MNNERAVGSERSDIAALEAAEAVLAPVTAVQRKAVV